MKEVKVASFFSNHADFFSISCLRALAKSLKGGSAKSIDTIDTEIIAGVLTPLLRLGNSLSVSSRRCTSESIISRHIN
jgi:hypothetical protein